VNVAKRLNKRDQPQVKYISCRKAADASDIFSLAARSYSWTWPMSLLVKVRLRYTRRVLYK